MSRTGYAHEHRVGCKGDAIQCICPIVPNFNAIADVLERPKAQLLQRINAELQCEESLRDKHVGHPSYRQGRIDAYLSVKRIIEELA